MSGRASKTALGFWFCPATNAVKSALVPPTPRVARRVATVPTNKPVFMVSLADGFTAKEAIPTAPANISSLMPSAELNIFPMPTLLRSMPTFSPPVAIQAMMTANCKPKYATVPIVEGTFPKDSRKSSVNLTSRLPVVPIRLMHRSAINRPDITEYMYDGTINAEEYRKPEGATAEGR